MTAVETSFRVFYFEPRLIKSFRKSRDKQEAVTREFVTQATDDQVSQRVKELRSVGLVAQTSRQAVRLEMSLSVLAALHDASGATGIPGQQLLAMCLSRASSGTKRKSR